MGYTANLIVDFVEILAEYLISTGLEGFASKMLFDKQALDPNDGNANIETFQRAATLLRRRVQLELV